MRRGDLIFAYQAAEGLVGLTRLASDGHSCHGDKTTDAFDLDSATRLWFMRSIPMKVIRDLPESSAEVEAVRMSQGTVYGVTSKGVALLAAAIGEANPGQAEDIYRFIRLSPSIHE